MSQVQLIEAEVHKCVLYMSNKKTSELHAFFSGVSYIPRDDNQSDLNGKVVMAPPKCMLSKIGRGHWVLVKEQNVVMWYCWKAILLEICHYCNQ